MRRVIDLIVLAIVGSVAASAIANAQQDPPGKTIYAAVWQGCHGLDGRGDIGPALVPPAEGYEDVLAIVRKGVGRMAPIAAERLSDDDVHHIVAYLKSSESGGAANAAGTVVTAATNRATAAKSIADKISDVSIRTVDAATGHVGIGIVYRTEGKGLRQFSTHDQVTEV